MMREEHIRRKFNQIRHLRKFAKMSDEEVWKAAEEKAFASHLKNFLTFLENKEERKLGAKLLSQYLHQFSVDSVSDKNALQQLVYLEVIQVRMQNEMNKVYQESGATNLKMVDALQQNLTSIQNLKQQLGLLGKDAEKNDAGKYLDLLKSKFKKWRSENQASRHFICPHCSQMVLLKIRTEAWEAQKHPTFKDRLLGNSHLIALYEQEKLTDEDVAKILGTSPDYTKWLVEKWKQKAPAGASLTVDNQEAVVQHLDTEVAPVSPPPIS